MSHLRPTLVPGESVTMMRTVCNPLQPGRLRPGQRPDPTGAARVRASNPPPEGLQDGVHPRRTRGAPLAQREGALHPPRGQGDDLVLWHFVNHKPLSSRPRAGNYGRQETPDQVRGDSLSTESRGNSPHRLGWGDRLPAFEVSP